MRILIIPATVHPSSSLCHSLVQHRLYQHSNPGAVVGMHWLFKAWSYSIVQVCDARNDAQRIAVWGKKNTIKYMVK